MSKIKERILLQQEIDSRDDPDMEAVNPQKDGDETHASEPIEVSECHGKPRSEFVGVKK
jgi:hypothetical protein